MAVAYSGFPLNTPFFELIASSPYETMISLPTGTNRALLIAITTSDAINYYTGSPVSVVVNPYSLGETCTLLGYQVDASVNSSIALYGLFPITSGSTVLRVTGIPDFAVGVVSALLVTGVKQTSIATAFTNLVTPKDLSGLSYPSVTVSSAIGNMVATAFNAPASYANAVDSVQWWRDIGGAYSGSGGSFIGGATSVTRNGSLNNVATWVGIGVNIVQDAIALTANNLTVGSKVFSAPVLGVARILLPSSFVVSQSPSFSTATFKGIHVLAGPALVPASGPTLGVPALGQTHVFPTSNFVTSNPTLASASLFIARVFSSPPTLAPVGTPAFSVPVFNQSQKMTAIFPINPPEIGTGVLGQKHVLPIATNFVDSPVALGGAVIGVGRFFVSTDLATQSPVLAAGGLSQLHVLTSGVTSAGRPEFGATSFVMVRALTALPLATSLPVLGLGRVDATNFLPAPVGLSLPSPTIVPSLVGELFPPLVWLRHRLKRWSNDPNDEYYDDDHSQDEGPVKQAIFSNHNDDIELTLSANTLVGRTLPGRGPAELIQPVDPLYLSEHKLWIDINRLAEELAGLEGAATLPLLSGISTDINLLNDKILAETSARKAAVTVETNARTTADGTLATNLTTETNARIAADAALDAKLIVLETRSYVDRGGVAVIAPASGFVYQVAADAGVVIINPSGNLTSGTFKLPTAPVGRQKIDFIATKKVNTLVFSTDNSAHALANPPSTVVEGKCITAVFGPTLQTWLFFA